MRPLRSGFTLIETILVITVAGTAAAMSFPQVARAITHTRVNQASVVAAGDFELAASLADRQRKPVRVAIDASRLTLTVTDRATGAVLAKRLFGPTSDFQLGSLSAEPTQVDFFPNGTVSGTMRLTVGAGDYSRHVTVSRAGQVRVTP